MGIAATSKHLTLTTIAIYRIVAAKIQEEWHYSDTMGLMRQLGIVPK
jgi:predicted ester cyclase